MTFHRIKRFFLCAAAGMVLLLSACQMFWSPHSPKGYLMPRPDLIILPKKVNEISGLNYISNREGLVAIADDKQKIYRLMPEGTVSNYFEEDIGDGAADYEDVVKVDSTIFIVVSNGSIKEVKKSDSGLIIRKYDWPLGGKNDFETLYYDSSANGLILLCKKCEADKGKKIRSAYRFDLTAKEFDTAPFYTISNQEVNNSLKDGDTEFDPSGATIHPLEKRLYILSSAGNLLVVADLRGKVQGAHRLNPTLYPQAEGIAFAPNGDMYISNEAKLGKPTLLKLVYQPKEK